MQLLLIVLIAIVISAIVGFIIYEVSKHHAEIKKTIAADAEAAHVVLHDAVQTGIADANSARELFIDRFDAIEEQMHQHYEDIKAAIYDAVKEKAVIPQKTIPAVNVTAEKSKLDV